MKVRKWIKATAGTALGLVLLLVAGVAFTQGLAGGWNIRQLALGLAPAGLVWENAVRPDIQTAAKSNGVSITIGSLTNTNTYFAVVDTPGYLQRWYVTTSSGFSTGATPPILKLSYCTPGAVNVAMTCSLLDSLALLTANLGIPTSNTPFVSGLTNTINGATAPFALTQGAILAVNVSTAAASTQAIAGAVANWTANVVAIIY